MKIAICSMIRDEHLYLKEWIDYHLNLGITSIYLLEDLASVSHKSITDLYSNVYLSGIGDIFSLSNFDRENILRNVANYFSLKLRNDYDWLAFLDPDEFIMCYEELPDVLSKYDDEVGVAVPWCTFNSNGHKYKLISTLLNYTEVCPNLCKDINYQVKSFGNLKNNPIWSSPHYIIGVNNPIKDIWINHYITRSFEDYCFKIYLRGDIYYRIYRTLDEFISYNPDFNKEWCEKYISEKYSSLNEYIEPKENLLKLVGKESVNLVGNIMNIPNKTYEIGPYGGFFKIPVLITNDIGKLEYIDPSGLYDIKFGNFQIIIYFKQWEYKCKAFHDIIITNNNDKRAVIKIERWFYN